MALDEPEGEVMQDGNVFSHYTNEMKNLIGQLDDAYLVSASKKAESEVSDQEPTGADDDGSEVKTSSSFFKKWPKETPEVRKERVKLRVKNLSMIYINY